MPDLTDWLAEQHAADERVALAAARAGANNVYPSAPEETAGWGWSGENVYADAHGVALATGPYGMDEAVGVHIARHDPQATLARIDAERMLVARHSAATNDFGDTVCGECDVIEDGMRSEGQWPCETLHALAWGYRHRDGWRSEWAPDGVEVGA